MTMLENKNVHLQQRIDDMDEYIIRQETQLQNHQESLIQYERQTDKLRMTNSGLVVEVKALKERIGVIRSSNTDRDDHAQQQSELWQEQIDTMK